MDGAKEQSARPAPDKRAGATEAARDAELVERLKKGDSRAFDDLFRRHREAAYRIAYRLLGNAEDASTSSRNRSSMSCGASEVSGGSRVSGRGFFGL